MKWEGIGVYFGLVQKLRPFVLMFFVLHVAFDLCRKMHMNL